MALTKNEKDWVWVIGFFVALFLGLSFYWASKSPGATVAQATDAGPPDAGVHDVGPPPPPRAPIEEWVARTYKDPLTRRDGSEALTTSREMIDLAFPYQGPQRATLRLRDDPQYGKDVILSIQRGQLTCHSRCSVQVVFDDAGPVRWQAVDAADGSSEMIFLRQYDRFSRRAERAKEIRISVTIYRHGTQVFTFPGRSSEAPDAG